MDYQTLNKFLLEFEELQRNAYLVLKQIPNFSDYLFYLLQQYSHGRWDEFLRDTVFLPTSSAQTLWNKCMQYCHLFNFNLLKFLLRKAELQFNLEVFSDRLKAFSDRLKVFSDRLEAVLANTSSVPTKELIEQLNPNRRMHSQPGNVQVLVGFKQNSWKTLHRIWSFLSDQLNIPFLHVPAISCRGEVVVLTYSVPKIVHKEILEWRLQLDLNPTPFKYLLINDAEYWQHIATSAAVTGSSSVSTPSSNLLSTSKILQEPMASLTNTLTQQCLSYICKSIQGEVLTQQMSGRPLTLHTVPLDLHLTLCYIGMLAHEESVVQKYNTITKLIDLPVSHGGLGYLNRGGIVLHPLMHQFLVAYYQNSQYFTASLPRLTLPRLTLPRLNTGYMPYFSACMQGRARTQGHALPTDCLSLFEAGDTCAVKIYFRSLNANQETEKISEDIYEELQAILGGNDDAMKTHSLQSSTRDQSTFCEVLKRFSKYITGALLYHSDCHWNITGITQHLVAGCLVAEKWSSVSTQTFDYLRCNVALQSEKELKTFSHFPTIVLSKTQEVRIVSVPMAESGLEVFKVLVAVKQECGSDMRLSLYSCLISKFTPFDALNQSRVCPFQRQVEQLLFLSSLSICNCTLTSDIIQGVSCVLKTSKNLLKFRCCYNNMNDFDIKSILRAIGNCASLRSIEFKQTLSIYNSELLFSSLQNPVSQVKLLKLADCSITQHTHQLQTYLETTRSLQRLDLHRNFIDYRCMQLLAEGLHCNHTLTQLNISFNPIGDEGLELLSATLLYNRHLQVLNANRIGVGSKGVSFLAAALLNNQNSSLKKLDLSWNLIKDDGALKLADLLVNNPPLVELNLNNNRICCRGARALALALDQFYNRRMEKLHLGNNLVGREGIEALKEVKERNPSCIVTWCVAKPLDNV